MLFLDALSSLRDEGVLSHPQLNPLPATPPPTRSDRRRQAKHDRKIAEASTVVGTIESLEDRGFTIVCTDGSSKKVKGVGWVGGHGIFVDSGTTLIAYLPSGSRQTNDAAELPAVVKALQLLLRGKIAICTDSDYVFLGATGAARRWKARGWVGSSGPVSNVSLWEILLCELDGPDREIERAKVPSHVSMQGNQQADSLATFRTGPEATHRSFLGPHSPGPHPEPRAQEGQCSRLPMPTRNGGGRKHL